MQLSRKSRFALACLALALTLSAVARSVAAPASSWQLGPGGYGPFKIGMSFRQVRRLAPRLRQTEAALLVSPDCDYLPLPGHRGVGLMFIDGRLRRIDDVYAGRWAEVQLIEGCS